MYYIFDYVLEAICTYIIVDTPSHLFLSSVVLAEWKGMHTNNKPKKKTDLSASTKYTLIYKDKRYDTVTAEYV